MANQLTSAPGHPNIERSPVSAHLGRMFQLLESVLVASAPIKISDLADRVEIPKPTVHRLVANMIAEGLLRTDPGMLADEGGLDGFFVGRWVRE